MTDFLIALGCSFTYGEGLSYELIKEKYVDTYEYIKKMDNHSNIYQYMFRLSRDFNEFNEYRIKHNYPNVLKDLLSVKLFSNGENGGSNIDRLNDLTSLINQLKREPNLIPKYCVFQITHSGRDIEKILLPNGNKSQYDILKNTYKEKFIKKVEDCDMGKKNVWGLDNLFDEANHLFIEKLIKEFNFLEKTYGTKCLFYMGLGDYSSIKSTYEKYKSYPYFFELKHNDIVYYTFLQMINELGWTFDASINIKDSHPNGVAHKWLAEELYKKLI